MQLSTFLNFRPARPGVYEFRLTLSTESADARAWLGASGYPGEEQVSARISLIPHLKIESDVLTVNVR
jgi:hypothetical protein